MMDFDALTGFLLQADTGTILENAPMLSAAIEELAPMVGFDQHSPYHAYDLYTHAANVTGKLPRDTVLRWAGLLHDLGKIPTFTQDETGRGHFRGHPAAGAELADAILTRLGAPEDIRHSVCLLIREHMTRLQPDRLQLQQCIDRFGWELTHKLLLLQQADMGSKGLEKPDKQDMYSEISRLLEEMK